MYRVHHVVWHRITRDDRFTLSIGCGDGFLPCVVRSFAAGLYEAVAEYTPHGVMRPLEAAYRLTQNIEHSWSIEPGPGLTPLRASITVDGETLGLRSSMCGDVIEQVEGGVVVGRWAVAMVGFTKLPVTP